MDYETLEHSITAWARAQVPVRALAVVGSRARRQRPADRWSDLDLMLFTTAPEAYVQDAAWLETFGVSRLRVLNRTALGDPEWMVLYAGGLKVDFFLAPAVAPLPDLLFGSRYGMVCRRAVRVLFDKDGATPERPSPPPAPPWSPPDEVAFSAVVQRFWLDAYRVATMVQRGELWRAKTLVDGQMKQALLQMLEWQAKAVHGAAYDTWHEGRFLHEWADAAAVARLPRTFAAYTAVDLQRALRETADLFTKLVGETAGEWGYEYSAPSILTMF